MKTFFTTAVTVLAVLILASGGLLVAHAATPSANNGVNSSPASPQILTLGLGGGVMSAGDQHYTIQQNGFQTQVPSEVLFQGDQFGGYLSYTLNVYQHGIVSKGTANILFVGEDSAGNSLTLSGSFSIVGNVAGVCLPSGNTPVNIATNIHKPECASLGTSEVPMYFLGSGQLQVNLDGAQSTVTMPMAFESAYFNPFGGPIVIASADLLTSANPTLMIVTTYTVATIDWTNVIDAGAFMGMLGATQITGTFQQVATEHEDLVGGTASDSGMMTLSGVTDSLGNPLTYMDGTGAYSGSSTISTAGSYPCPGVPFCTETGFQDSGSFQITGGHGHSSALIDGSYLTDWGVPAFTFVSSVTGTVTQ